MSWVSVAVAATPVVLNAVGGGKGGQQQAPIKQGGGVVPQPISDPSSGGAGALGALGGILAESGVLTSFFEELFRSKGSTGTTKPTQMQTQGGIGNPFQVGGQIFKDGGVVKGEGPQQVTAEGGELILNTDQQAQLLKLLVSTTAKGNKG